MLKINILFKLIIISHKLTPKSIALHSLTQIKITPNRKPNNISTSLRIGMAPDIPIIITLVLFTIVQMCNITF